MMMPSHVETCVICNQGLAKAEVIPLTGVRTPLGELILENEVRMVCPSGDCEDYYTGEQAEAHDRHVKEALRMKLKASPTVELRGMWAQLRGRGGSMKEFLAKELRDRGIEVAWQE
jgi:hypothetical protein